VSTRREIREERERRHAMARKYPPCRWCRKPVVAGQVDGERQPAHFGCQLAFFKVAPRVKGRVALGQATVNPRLPQFPTVPSGGASRVKNIVPEPITLKV
jgi:hypothetical protein